MCREATTDQAQIMTLFGGQDGRSWVIAVTGELDISGCDAITQGFADAAAARSERVVVDASGVTFVDGGGLRVLETAMALYGGEVWLRAPSQPVRWIAEMVGLGPTGWRGTVSSEDVRLS